jgi:hypothetical protein
MAFPGRRARHHQLRIRLLDEGIGKILWREGDVNPADPEGRIESPRGTVSDPPPYPQPSASAAWGREPSRGGDWSSTASFHTARGHLCPPHALACSLSRTPGAASQQIHNCSL